MFNELIGKYIEGASDEELFDLCAQYLSTPFIRENPYQIHLLMNEFIERFKSSILEYKDLADETSDSALLVKVEKLEQEVIDLGNEVTSLENEVSFLEEQLAEKEDDE